MSDSTQPVTRPASTGAEGYDTTLFPSLVQLLVRPNDYHGKQVVVKGFFVFEAHGEESHIAIYLSRDDASYMITKNGFAIAFDERQIRSRETPLGQFHEKFVLIEGTFDSKQHGHMGLWPGTMYNVRRIVALAKRDKGDN